MKPWVPMGICCVLVAAAFVFRGCAAESGKAGDSPEGAAPGAMSGPAAGREQGDADRRRGSKTRRGGELPARAVIRNKLKSIIIPKISFEDTTLEEAIDFLRLRTLELDPDPDPRMRGVSLIIRKPSPPEAVDVSSMRIRELNMENASVWELLHLVAREFRMEVEITDAGVVIAPP